jgi:hypothetical protein
VGRHHERAELHGGLLSWPPTLLAAPSPRAPYHPRRHVGGVDGIGSARRVRVPGSALVAGVAPALAAEPAAPPRVELFTPSGTVKQVRQVVARFSTPMVALGDPRLADPFDVDCPARGAGHWADARSWVYDFEADLGAGVRCTFTLKAKLAAFDRRAVTGARAFSFDTGGPAIVDSFPSEGWEEIDEQQVFLLKLDAPATPESIAAHAHCSVAGLAERVPVAVLQGDERREMLDQRKSLGYEYFRLLWKSGTESSVRVRDRSLEDAEDRIVALQCQRRLPPATQVQVVWGKGIAAHSGIATRADQRLAFRVRPAFLATLECSRTEPRAGCAPISPITVKFSAPVAREQALAARLRLPGGETREPEARGDERAKVLESIAFAPPFPEAVVATLELPAIVDDAGRSLENGARFPLDVRIDEFPPLVKFAGEFGILEAREGGVLPVTLRNIDAPAAGAATAIAGRVLRVAREPAEVASWLRRAIAAATRRGQYVEGIWRDETGAESVFGAGDPTTPLSVTKPEGARPAEVVGIPLAAPGFYVVELESRRLGAALLGRDATRYVATSALVTDLAVHFKWGRESSRVWVTRLSDGGVVADAAVVVSDYCSGKELWRGATGRDGIAAVETTLGEPHGEGDCYPGALAPLLVTAAVADDWSFALSGWSKGITPWAFGFADRLPTRPRAHGARSPALTARARPSR